MREVNIDRSGRLAGLALPDGVVSSMAARAERLGQLSDNLE